jgi:hypothetical protein
LCANEYLDRILSAPEIFTQKKWHNKKLEPQTFLKKKNSKKRPKKKGEISPVVRRLKMRTFS